MRQQSTVANRYPSRFTVGRDSAGNWVVTDRRGLVGGVFADRSSALHFAMAESDHNPAEVCAALEGAVLTRDAMFLRH